MYLQLRCGLVLVDVRQGFVGTGHLNTVILFQNVHANSYGKPVHSLSALVAHLSPY